MIIGKSKLELDKMRAAGRLVGQVVGVHIAGSAVRDGRVDTAGLRPIARCGYRGDYAVVDELFEMLRPD